MSSMVDERVVQMSFDNSQFEKGVSQTIGSLDKLDQSLEQTSKGEYFENMRTEIVSVRDTCKASAMVINGVLLSIGNVITGYLLRAIKSLKSGIDDGFREYETQMGATQTILANVKDEGKGIEDVTAALDELNVYADKTIYNFTEMTRNIGMFTAAGANLDTSVATIKGLANAAALVGANATTAARAWYQVSQAMAAGSFKLMDWRSLEISNIAGEGFKSVLTEVARKDGLAVAKMIDNGTALRDTLKSGWLTAQRFSEAMEILTNEWSKEDYLAHGYSEEQYKLLHEIAEEAMNAAVKVKSLGQLIETTKEAIGSGWAVTFRTIIGDFEKARTLFTRISITLNSVIDKISDYRNHFLDFIWNKEDPEYGSAYNNFKETIDNILAIFSTFVGAIRAGFHNIFGWGEIRKNLSQFAKTTNDITRQFVLNTYRDTTLRIENAKRELKGLDKLEPNETNRPNIWDLDAVNENITKLIRVFRGLFAGVDIILRTIGDTVSWLIEQIPGIGDFYKNLREGNLSLLDNLANIGDKILMVRDMIVDLNLIPNLLNLIKQSIIDIIKTNPLINIIANAILFIIYCINNLIIAIKNLDVSPFSVLVGAIKLVFVVVSTVFNYIIEMINGFGKAITGDDSFSIFDFLGEKAKEFLVFLNDIGTGVIDLGKIIDDVKEKISNILQYADEDPLFKMVGAIVGIIATVLLLSVALKKLFDALSGTDPAATLSESIYNFSTALNSTGISIGVGTFSDSLIKFAIALIMVAAAFKYMPEEMSKAIPIVAAMSAVLFLLVKMFGNIKSTVSLTNLKSIPKFISDLASSFTTFMKVAGIVVILTTFSNAIVKLAGALVAMASVDGNKLAHAVTGMILLMSVLGIATFFIEKGAKSITSGFGKTDILAILSLVGIIASLAIVTKILASAIIDIASNLDTKADKIMGAAIALGILISVIGVMTTLILQKSSEVNITTNTVLTFLSIAGLFLGIGAAISLIIAASSLITKQEQVNNIIASMVGMISSLVFGLGAMLGSIAIIKTMSINTADITNLVIIVAAATAALSVMSLALSASAAIISVSNADVNKLWPILGMIGVTVAVMLGIVAILSKAPLSELAIISTVASILAITYSIRLLCDALKVLDNVTISDSAFVALGGLLALSFIFVAVISALAVLGSEGITEIVVVALGVIALYFVSIGAMTLMMAEAVTKMQQAILNVFNAIKYVGKFGTEIIDTLESAAEFVKEAIPALATLFYIIGVGVSEVYSSFVQGLADNMENTVPATGNLILLFLKALTVWVLDNSDKIYFVVKKIFAVIGMIVVMAASMVFLDIIPNLAVYAAEAILRAFENTVAPTLDKVTTFISDFLNSLSIAFGYWEGEDSPLAKFCKYWSEYWDGAVDKLHNCVNKIIEKLEGLIDTINLVLEAFGFLSIAIDTTSEEMDEAAETMSEDAEQMSEAYEDMGETVTTTNSDMVASTLSGTDIMSKAFEGFWNGMATGNWDFLSGLTDGWNNFFTLGLDNQELFWLKYLTGEKYYGEEYNEITSGYLIKNAELASTYYGKYADIVLDYHEKLAEYALMSQNAKDATSLQAASKWKQENVDPLVRHLEHVGITLKDLAQDGIDWEFTSQHKEESETEFKSWLDFLDGVEDYINNYKAPEVDTSMFTPSFGTSGSGTDTSALDKAFQERNDKIKKYDSEVKPKDLTPTIDLDSLKNEINQANGIVTGSLLAAQNAAIGDYINQDSELNPFLKDRWQNTYNFTQNNYSPKALSRIDIYRQTQNQLRLSRGF